MTAKTTLTIEGLLQPTECQHLFIEDMVNTMTKRELKETLLLLVFLDPASRSILLDAAAQTTGSRPFSERRRR